MDYATTTDFVIFATVIVLILYDVWVRLKVPDATATISWQILILSKRYPVIAFGLGFLMGHLVFQNCTVN